MKTYIELFAGLSPLSEVLPWKEWSPALIVEKCNYVNHIRERLHPFTREEARIMEDINEVEALPRCDLLLAPELVINAPSAGAGAQADVFDGGLFVSELGKAGECCLNDELPAGKRPGLWLTFSTRCVPAPSH